MQKDDRGHVGGEREGKRKEEERGGKGGEREKKGRGGERMGGEERTKSDSLKVSTKLKSRYTMRRRPRGMTEMIKLETEGGSKSAQQKLQRVSLLTQMKMGKESQ